MCNELKQSPYHEVIYDKHIWSEYKEHAQTVRKAYTHKKCNYHLTYINSAIISNTTTGLVNAQCKQFSPAMNSI